MFYIPGVFADNDSDDSGGGAQRRTRGSNKSQRNYTAHIPFVAGGIQQSGKKKDPAQAETESRISEDDENEEASPKSAVLNTSSESEEEAPRNAGFGLGNTAGFRSAPSTQTPVAGARWDQHTRGIGAKLLLQMGYQPGKGLGKDLQGISQPVQAYVRKGRGAIGAYGAEKPQTIGDGSKAVKAKVDEDVREQQEFQQKMNQWRKSDAAAKGRYSYKSVQDVIDKGKTKNYILSDRMR